MKYVNSRRIVNTSPSMPHVVRHQSIWFIIPPKDGTVWRKAKRKQIVEKEIHDKKGNVVRVAKKQLISYAIEQVMNEDGSPKIERFRNYADLPSDAADKALFGEFRGTNPETGERDLYYHGGDLAPIEDVHEEFSALITAAEKKEEALAIRQEQIRAKELELEKKKAAIADLDRELAEKERALEAQKAALAGKEAERTPDSPTPPQPAKTILRKAAESKGGDTPPG